MAEEEEEEEEARREEAARRDREEWWAGRREVDRQVLEGLRNGGWHMWVADSGEEWSEGLDAMERWMEVAEAGAEAARREAEEATAGGGRAGGGAAAGGSGGGIDGGQGGGGAGWNWGGGRVDEGTRYSIVVTWHTIEGVRLRRVGLRADVFPDLVLGLVVVAVREQANILAVIPPIVRWPEQLRLLIFTSAVSMSPPREGVSDVYRRPYRLQRRYRPGPVKSDSSGLPSSQLCIWYCTIAT